jgi:hypothetical protein
MLLFAGSCVGAKKWVHHYVPHIFIHALASSLGQNRFLSSSKPLKKSFIALAPLLVNTFLDSISLAPLLVRTFLDSISLAPLLVNTFLDSISLASLLVQHSLLTLR